MGIYETSPKRMMHSFTVGNGPANLEAITKACELRKEELQFKAKRDKQDCNFQFEIIEGMDTYRVNIYDGNSRDVFEIGYNFCLAQKQVFR